jgi:hypothetical protein
MGTSSSKPELFVVVLKSNPLRDSRWIFVQFGELHLAKWVHKT